MKYTGVPFDDYCAWLMAIANEIAEQNRLKLIEMELKIIEMQGVDPESQGSLAKEDAFEFMSRLQNKENVKHD